ncbi:MAG: arylsulfatase A-like enzyme [Mariniblastus sp.]|jgi:arylsulfatase A-like enzyme
MLTMLKLIFSSLFVISFTASAFACNEPNIVVILTDDQGYADFSFNAHHPQEVQTPHMDALAANGVYFSQAYISGNVCSPTRAGLMLGQYQQRVGVYDAGTGGSGFDPTTPIFPAMLPDTYYSGAFGKWHLGLDDDFPALKWHPLSRGFDSFYGFMGRGAHDYFDLHPDSEGKFKHPLYRDRNRINDEGYLTTRLTEEAVQFIHQQHEKPFFLYLAYNAVHAPAQAPEADIEKYRAKYPHLSEKRAILMAMLEHLDDGVGDVVKALKDTDSFDDTLLFFLTDNGGAGAMEANNAPLRGLKGQVYEGGHRTPFVVSWPARFEGGRVIDTPIISLDVLPTVLDAVGQLKPDNTFDGKSLLSLIEGKTKKHHANLFWSEGGSTGEWAVRSGDFKLLGLKDRRELYNLAEDPAESNDLMDENPEQAGELEKRYNHWLSQMAMPANGAPKRFGDAPVQTDKASKRAKRKADRSDK